MVGGTMCHVRASVVVLEALERWESRACSENKQLLPAEGPCHWPYSSQQQVSHQVPASPSRTHIHTCATHTHTHARAKSQSIVHVYTHTHTHRWECVCVCVCVCEGGPGTTYREQRGKSGKNAASSNKSHHNAEKNPQPHPQKRKKNLVSLFQSSQKCLTKAEIENILDKRIQAPFWKGPHTKLCVIPTRNWFIYQKIIRFNAKALRPQIKDNKWWVHWRGLGRKRRTTLGWKFSLFLCLLFSGSLFTRHTQDFAWRSSYSNSGAGAAQNGPPQNKRKQ